jgi:rhodanese-related sulfurtransferase
MKTFKDFIAECTKSIEEILPWDLQALLEQNKALFLFDIREPYEFKTLHIKGSLNVPRGILECACEYDYEDTVPELAAARDEEIILICRSGNRSALAAYTLQLMGFKSVKSLKLGLKGWNDYELPLQNIQGDLMDTDDADAILYAPLRAEQKKPKND